MTVTRPHDPLDDVLRSLDAADATLTPEQVARGDALLAHLVPAEAPARRPRRRAVGWLVPTAAAAALVVGTLVFPTLGSSQAYADWTPTPTPVAALLLDRVSGACRATLTEWPGSTKEGLPAGEIRLVASEQRGSRVFVALVSSSGGEIQCLADAGTAQILGATGGVPTTAVTIPTPGPRGIVSGGVGLSTEGPKGYAFTTGTAGADVRAVTIRSGRHTVTATLDHGTFAAWWPVTGAATTPPFVLDAAYDLTLADGTVVRDVDTGMGGRRPGPTEIGRVERGGGVEGARHIAFAGGLAGSQVVGVTVHAASRDVVATVADGTFRARWDVADAAADEGAVTYTLTLADGTVRSRVRPVSGADA